MVPPLIDDLPEDLFLCGLCSDLVLEPKTLQCCGRSFCRRCLQCWIQTSVQQAGVPRCPAGCGQKLPFRLPACSRMLQRAIEAILPEELKQRTEDANEDEAAPQMPGGFREWQEIAAARDLRVGASMVVAFGTPGVVVGPFNDQRLIVKFDERLDDSELCMNVMPCEVVPQLPAAFGVRIGQRVVAANDLIFGTEIGVRFGVRGTVRGAHGTDRVCVQFDERVDGTDRGVNCFPMEIRPCRRLVGGFQLAQRVAAARDLYADQVLLVRGGTPGIIRAEYNDIRVSVKFDERADSSSHLVNVMHTELVPLQDDPAALIPADLP